VQREALLSSFSRDNFLRAGVTKFNGLHANRRI
jgi:hypothetical protein